MEVTHDSFIGVYDNAFSAAFCDRVIAHYEWCAKNNRSWDRPENDVHKKDTSCCINPVNTAEIAFSSPNMLELLSEFNSVFWDQWYADYRRQYGVLDQYSRHTIYTYKVQKTLPAGGYHIWHCEDAEREHSRRVGVYIIYLNDVAMGGETEFLYCSKRVEAKKGRLVIFPPNFPWAHRGNPPLNGEKYILTGWTEFA